MVEGKEIPSNITLLLSDITEKLFRVASHENSSFKALKLFLQSNKKFLKLMPSNWKNELDNVTSQNVQLVWKMENAAMENMRKVNSQIIQFYFFTLLCVGKNRMFKFILTNF